MPGEGSATSTSCHSPSRLAPRLEAERSFRRVKGCQQRAALVAAVRRHATGENVTPGNYDQGAA
jgi:hypothetical protein